MKKTMVIAPNTDSRPCSNRLLAYLATVALLSIAGRAAAGGQAAGGAWGHLALMVSTGSAVSMRPCQSILFEMP